MGPTSRGNARTTKWGRSAIKRVLRGLTNRFVGPHRAGDHVLYKLYLRVFYPDVISQRQAELSFYKRMLGLDGASLIFDIGANVGDKSRTFRQIAVAVIAVEPNPVTFAVLKDRFAGRGGIRVVEQACGAAPGFAEMTVFKTSHALSTLAGRLSEPVQEAVLRSDEAIEKRCVAVTTLDELVARFGMPQYIKIDVEGFELEVLNGLSVAVPFVSFECNLPDFVQETVGCVKALAGLSADYRFNFVLTEPPARMVRDAWIEADEMVRIVREGQHPYMEIYARLLAASGVDEPGTSTTST